MKFGSPWRRALIAPAIACAAAVLAIPAAAAAAPLPPAPARALAPARARAHVTPVLSLPSSQLPESVAVNRHGTMYLSLFSQGEILRVLPDGARSVFAVFPAGSQALGVRVDFFGNVYAAVAGPDGGVWRIPAAGGTPVRLFAMSGFPNGLALDGHGDVYASDSTGGAIYKMDRSGTVTRWSDSPLLAGTTGDGPCGLPHPSGLPLGVNGLAVDPATGDLLAANTTLGTIVRIPVLPGGKAGRARVVAGPDCRLWGADGIAFNGRGDLFVAANAAEDIVRVSPYGTLRVLASAAAGDPLSSPSDIAFLPGWRDRNQLLISNFALFHGGTGAGVVMLTLGPRFRRAG